MDTLSSFTDLLDDVICDSQPLSLPSSIESITASIGRKDTNTSDKNCLARPAKGTAQRGQLRSIQEIDSKYRDVFTYPYFNLIQSSVIDDALYTDKSIVVCAPTGSGKTVIFEMAIVQLLMELEDKNYTEDFKIIYMAPVKALCTERITEWYPKFTKLGLLCIEATGDTDVDFTQLKPYKIIITTPEKWDILTRRWRDHRNLVEVIKLFLIDEVHILNDESRGPVLEAVVSRMKTIESSAQAVHRIELLQNQLHGTEMTHKTAPNIRFVAVSATISNPEDVANWLSTEKKPAVYHKFGDECRPVKLKRIVEGYHCPAGTSIFKFDIILNYKLWPIIQKYHSGKPTLIFCNTRKSVILTAETLSRELTINFNAEQRAKLTTLASIIKNKKLQSLVMSGVGCHHAGMLYEERQAIENAFRNRDLPILITTTTLAMGVNLPAHLVIVKNTQQYVNGAYQEYSISTVLQMVGRAGRPQFDTDATAVIMTRLADKARYQALVGGCEPLQSYLHKRLPENLNSEAALRTIGDVAQCVQWLRSTFLYVRAARDPKKYLSLPQNSPQQLISKKIEVDDISFFGEVLVASSGDPYLGSYDCNPTTIANPPAKHELCVKAMNSLASSGLITMDEACCIESTEAGRLMSIFYLDLETMKQLMKIEGTETLEHLLTLISECHELSDMHLRVDERRCLNTLNRNNTGVTIRFQMKGKISTRQMKLNCVIQAVLGCIAIPDPSLNQEAMKIMRIADRVCKCLVAYVTRPDLISHQPQFYLAVKNSIILAKCIAAHLWENSPFVSKQLKGIGPMFSTLLASAGKANFMLLEESHPRDLERIMNKGAPAGNVLRKQISLLPKYQLSLLPLDESTVTLQLVLLNQVYLSENIEELTAGSNHKSYIVVGDSNNHILLLASFKDKDLISIFDGTIIHEIRRKHNGEHKIFAHCISSSFVGIDVQSEYFFKRIITFFETVPKTFKTNETSIDDKVKKQTHIEDSFKNRKRKSRIESDNSQSKEKKKRDSAVLESFKYLKNTFETASKKVKDNLDSTVKTKVVQVMNNLPEKENSKEHHLDVALCSTNTEDPIIIDDFNSEDFIDDAKVDSILAEIENEMSKQKTRPIEPNSLPSNNFNQKIKTGNSVISFNREPINKLIIPHKRNPHKITKVRKPLNTKSNYSIIDSIENDLHRIDDSGEETVISNNNGFSETVQSHINEYIQQAQSKTNTLDTNLELLLHNLESTRKNNTSNDNDCTTSNEKQALVSTQNPSSYCATKNVLGFKDGGAKMINCEENLKEIPNTEYLIVDSKENMHIENLINKHNKELIMPLNNNLHSVACDTGEICLAAINEPELNELSITKRNIYKDISKYQVANKQEAIPFCKTEDSKSLLIETTVNKSPTTQENARVYTNQHHNTRNESANQIFKDCNAIDTYNNNVNDIIKTKKNAITKITIPNEFCFYHKMIETAQKMSISTIENDNSRLFSYITSCPKTNELSQNKSQSNITNSRRENSIDGYSNCVTNNNIDMLNACIYKKNIISNNIGLKLDMADIILPNNTNKLTSDSKLSNNSSAPHLNDFNNTLSNSEDLLSNDRQISEPSDRNTIKYINNYRYTAKEISISTKDLPICSIRGVRKIKMDLNVTEIITTFQSENENILPKLELKQKSEKPINLSGNLSNYNQHIDGINIMIKKDMEQKNETETQECLPLLNSETTSTNVNSTPYIINHTQKQNLYNNSNKNLGAFGDFTHVNEIYPKIRNLKKNEIKLHEKRSKIEEPSDSTKIEKDNVKNVLEKYSDLFREDSAKTKISPGLPSFKNIACSKTSLTRSKKPFKICDIQQLEATLPENIIDYDDQHFQQNLESFTPLVDIEPTIAKDTQSEYYMPCLVKDTVDDVICHEITDEALKPIQMPEEVDLEVVPDYKMDLSMFDPKALLQCTVDYNEQEIIPPPAQFCDNSTSSLHYSCEDIEDYNVASNSSYCEELQSQLLDNTNLNYDSNIFEANSPANLLPHEIETWTLSSQDYTEYPSSYSSPVKSLTVICKNTPTTFDTPGNNQFSRQTKLGQFKFNRKDKLRKWK